MANLKKTLTKVVEGEHLAANALAVAASKAKELDIQQFLASLSAKHETNAVTTGTKLKELGGKYPTPGLRDSLKKGWESVATAKTTTEALKLLQKKEREAVSAYKDVLKKSKDENVMGLVARNLADSSESLTELGSKIKDLQKKDKKKGGFLGLPTFFWIGAAGTGAAIAAIRARRSSPTSPTKPGNGTPAGDSNKS